MKAAVLLQLLLVSALFAAPTDAVQAALQDARQLGQAAAYVRYLDLSAIPEAVRKDFPKVLDFQANSLSREADLVPLVRVGQALLRITPSLYGEQFARTWETLADADPYYHLLVEKEQEYGYYADHARTQWVKTRVERVKVRALAPWLPTKEITELATLTKSQAPIVRADWWLRLTAIQQVGKGHSYYEFLGLKKRSDYEDLIGLDRKLAEKKQQELRAIVEDGGVGVHNRQILWLATITGGHWRTLDPKKNVKGSNAIRNLDEDFRHDAEEHYGFLPNGLFALYLSDAKGAQQDVAPGDIASNHKTFMRNDYQVHIPHGCVTCHVEGIRPIEDWARQVYTPPVGLGATDYAKFLRLKRLYLGPLEDRVEDDRARYARALKRLTGLAPVEMAKRYDACVRWYHAEKVDVVQAAVELGCSKERLLAVLNAELRGYRYAPVLDPVLAGLIKGRPILRDHWEEVYGICQQILAAWPEVKP